MTEEFYEFEKIKLGNQKKYIFQYVKGRELTYVYHSHDFYEMICCMNGNGVKLINGNKLTCEKNTVIILRPGDKHCFLSQSKDIAIISLSVEKEEFEGFAGAYDNFLPSKIRREREPVYLRGVSTLPYSVFDVYQSTGGDNEYECKFLLSCFLKSYTDSLQNSGSVPQRLTCAIGELKKPENLKRGINAFTELSNYSQSQLARLIKKYFNVSLKQYINELRLQRAYSDIVLTVKSMEDISEELGFASFSHFNKIFKARFSVTPAALRKNNGGWTT